MTTFKHEFNLLIPNRQKFNCETKPQPMFNMPIRKIFCSYSIFLLPTLLTATNATFFGCNDRPNEAIPVQPMKDVSPDDPRVVEVDGKLYAKGSEPPPQVPIKVPPKPGSGRPDETNGVCRLYAPLLSEPKCCKRNFGFDEAIAREICGLGVYLGESFQYSCGYYFFQNPDLDQEPTEVRLSKIAGSSTKAVASGHDMVMQRRLKDPKFKSIPIPRLKDGYWSHRDGLNWAFIPGWDTPRQVSWHDGFCSPEKMPALLAAIASAPQPPPEIPATRNGLLPGFYRPDSAPQSP